MKPGDRIKVKNYISPENNDIIYTVLEVLDGWIRMKHPSIPGWFGTTIENVVEVLDDNK